VQLIVVWTATILGLIRFLTWFDRSNAAAWIIGTFLLSFPPIYYTLLSSGRYRYSVQPLLVPFAGDFVRRMVVLPRGTLMRRDTIARTAPAGAS
jgi:hypothetical protein